MYRPPQTIDNKVIPNEDFFDLVDQLIKEGRKVVITPKGNSMMPFIRNGRDEVTLESLSRPAEVGDIILARIGSNYVMHRVFAVDGDAITLMGDGNLSGKEYCGHADVIGIVTGISKDGGEPVPPVKGKLWRMLRPIRRFILVVYRKVIL